MYGSAFPECLTHSMLCQQHITGYQSRDSPVAHPFPSQIYERPVHQRTIFWETSTSLTREQSIVKHINVPLPVTMWRLPKSIPGYLSLCASSGNFIILIPREIPPPSLEKAPHLNGNLHFPATWRQTMTWLQLIKHLKDNLHPLWSHANPCTGNQLINGSDMTIFSAIWILMINITLRHLFLQLKILTHDPPDTNMSSSVTLGIIYHLTRTLSSKDTCRCLQMTLC
jgi:hypothetical protein